MRLGVFGGVFNPPHLGHMILAQEAHSALSLDTVAFVPLGDAAHREVEQDPGTEQRFAMCERATAGDDRFTVSRIEIDRPGPSYTVDTLRQLHAASPDDELLLLVGGDQGAALPTWHRVDEILSLATVAIAERDDWRRAEIVERLGTLCDDGRVTFFEMPRVEVSSTLVRRRIHERKPISYLVPDPVRELISSRGLYRASTAVAAG